MCQSRIPRITQTTTSDTVNERIDTVDERRHFVENDDPGDAVWEEITGATSDTYTPVQVLDANEVTLSTRIQTTVGACGPRFRYEDGIDPTQVADDPSTTMVNEVLEGTWAATEHPVKAIDERNKEPVFTDDGMFDVATVSSYTQLVAENSEVDVPITEAFPAADVFQWDPDGEGAAPDNEGREDDDCQRSPDLLPERGGDDSPFTITGTITGTLDDATSDKPRRRRHADYRCRPGLRGAAGAQGDHKSHRPVRRIQRSRSYRPRHERERRAVLGSGGWRGREHNVQGERHGRGEHVPRAGPRGVRGDLFSRGCRYRH